MSKLSRKHHYIPQFYLKGFCRSDNTFAVYDKEYNHFRNQPQSPAGNFFEKYRNTIIKDGIRTDIIEKHYNNLETEFAKLFQHIQSNAAQNEIITKDGLYLLKTFLAIQFWRLPLVDSFADDFIKNFDLKKVGPGITINGKPIGEIKEINRLLKTNKDFRYYFRCFCLPILTFDVFSNNDSLDNWYIFDVEDRAKWAKQICGDNPLVIGGLQSFLKFSGFIIFPLTKSRILIHSPTNKNLTEIEPEFNSMLSLLIFIQSQKYICGPDEEDISKIIENYREFSDNIRVMLPDSVS